MSFLLYAKIVAIRVKYIDDRFVRVAETEAPSPKEKAASKETAHPNSKSYLLLTLTGLEARLCFVDHINTALAAHDTTVAVTRLQRAERVFNLHRSSPLTRR
jgi:hypothetical protein